jgi:hypothetical protein
MKLASPSASWMTVTGWYEVKMVETGEIAEYRMTHISDDPEAR